MTLSRCLSNTELLRILNGPLPPDEAMRTEDHLDACHACQSLLIDMVEALAETMLCEDRSLRGHGSPGGHIGAQRTTQTAPGQS